MKKRMSCALAFGLIFLGAALSAAVTEQPVAPAGNPDDQMRFFWGIEWGMYESVRDAGFNVVVVGPWGPIFYDIEKGKGRDGDISGYLRRTDQLAADDVTWMVFLTPFRPDYLKQKYPRTNRDGTKNDKVMDPNAPGSLDELRRSAEHYAKVFRQFKCKVGVMPSTEERMNTRPSFSSWNNEAYKRATGLDVPPEADGREAPHWSKLSGIPADRVVPEDHPVLSYYRWFWKEGDGFERGYQVFLDAFRRELGYTPVSYYDPVIRVPPLWGSGGNVTHNDHWTMCVPFPYQVSYSISEQNAFAKGCPGQGVVTIIQGILDSKQFAPTNDLPANPPAWRMEHPDAWYVTPPPDMVNEELWSAVSRKVDGIGVHGWCSVWTNGAAFNYTRNYYVYTTPDTRRVFEDFFRTVAVPLGPLLRAVPERAPEVAVLHAYSAEILSGRAPWDWLFPSRNYGYMAEAANLAPVSLFEEEIARDGIPESVKVILAPKLEVVTPKTAAALKAFRARGGKLVADGKLAPALTADAQLPEKIVQSWDAKDMRNGVRLEGIWQGSVRELAATCRPWTSHYVDVDREKILVRARTAGDADYVFAINDLRGYGDYFGPWKRILDKGLPNACTVTVRRAAGAVYDLVRHTPVPFEVKDGVTTIPVSFQTSDGRLYLVVSKPLGKLTVTAKGTDEGLAVTVTSPDREVFVPIAVKVGDAKPYTGVVRNGTWSHLFKGAKDVRAKVVNLATSDCVSSVP